MQEAVHPLLQKCTHSLRRRMDCAEVPKVARLSLELPTEDAVPQTKRVRCSMQRMEHKQKFKKTKEKCCQTAFCYPKLINSGFKDSFGIKSKEEKKKTNKLEVY